MRPLELRLRGFRSYHGDDCSFDFRDRRLVGIVGPIGSGKSTILDAIAFALYGRTARIGRGTKSLINQRADHAAVALRFTVGDDVWEVQRSLRRKGQSQHALYRLSGDSEPAEHVDQVLQEGPVNDRIEELLGLDFAAFSRSVLLAQNQFDQFLSAAPRDRDKVLKGVFGHDRIDRMRELARERSREAEVEAEKATVRLQALEEAKAGLEERQAALASVRERIEVLEEHQPELSDLEERTVSMAAELSVLDGREQELIELAERLPDADDVRAIAAGLRSTVELREAATEAMEAAHRRLISLEEAHSADLLRVERGKLETAAAALARREGVLEALTLATQQTAEQSKRLEAATTSVRAEEDVLEASRLALADAEEVLAAATTALHAAQHGDRAALLQEALVAGEPCPVCRQRVDVLPEAEERPALETAAAAEGRERAETQRVSAAGAVEATAARVAAARSAVENITADLEAARERVATAEAALAGIDGELVELVGEGPPAELVAERKNELEAVEQSLEAARKSLDESRVDHDEAIVAQQSARKRVSDLEVEIAAVAARLGIEVGSVGDDVDALVGLVDQARSRLQQEHERVAERRAELAESIEAGRRRMDQISELVHLEGTIEEALAAARATASLHGEEIERLQTRIADADELEAERDRSITDRDLHARLASDLTDARFIRFLLDEERERLADLGSEHFQRLSDGRYRFTDDGTFEIVDLTTADAVRKADSLSGGEIFLASLGLALALAEMVARTGGRLEAFFLDEGFGSLDPEHLDLAMEGIESLAAEHPDRLVVTVSHVPEMRHRIEDLIALERDPATGDTRVLRA